MLHRDMRGAFPSAMLLDTMTALYRVIVNVCLLPQYMYCITAPFLSLSAYNRRFWQKSWQMVAVSEVSVTERALQISYSAASNLLGLIFLDTFQDACLILLMVPE